MSPEVLEGQTVAGQLGVEPVQRDAGLHARLALDRIDPHHVAVPVEVHQRPVGAGDRRERVPRPHHLDPLAGLGRPPHDGDQLVLARRPLDRRRRARLVPRPVGPRRPPSRHDRNLPAPPTTGNFGTRSRIRCPPPTDHPPLRPRRKSRLQGAHPMPRADRTPTTVGPATGFLGTRAHPIPGADGSPTAAGVATATSAQEGACDTGSRQITGGRERRRPRANPGPSAELVCEVVLAASLERLDDAGRTLCTSPTMPRSATEKIGASASLLMAMMFFEPFMPTMCWVAPEMPAAM